MDTALFEQARQRVIAGQKAAGGIGTLSEKSMHATLKHYMDPYEGSHEQKIGRYVADIVGEDGIVEIQTRGLYRLAPKLAAFLEVTPVTVVHPVIRSKWIIWLDADSGRPLSRRKSPLHESFYTAFHELYGIKQMLTHPGLRICLLQLDVEEYRVPTGKRRRGRGSSVKQDCIPIALVDRLDIRCAGDYAALLPEGLPDAFTSLDFAACAGVHISTAQAALNVLRHVGIVQTASRLGRHLLYERACMQPAGIGPGE